MTQGARIMHRKGYNHTGVAEVVAAAGVPKGSFYFYFPSKEAFGLEIVDVYRDLLVNIAKSTLETDLPALERLSLFFNGFNAYYKDNGYKDGCPIGNLCQEMGDVSEAFGDKLCQTLSYMQTAFAKILDEARQAGEIDRDINVDEMAGFILSGWQGALMRMKVERGPDSLDVFTRMVFERLLKKP